MQIKRINLDLQGAGANEKGPPKISGSPLLGSH
jgi:hypothetical protein